MTNNILKQFYSYGLMSHQTINGVGLFSEEIDLFLKLLEDNYQNCVEQNHGRYLEVGTSNGGSLLLTLEFCRQKQKENPNFSASIFSVDLKYPAFFHLNMKRAGLTLKPGEFSTYEAFTGEDDSICLRFFEQSSLEVDLGNLTKLDFVFLDGLHQYKTLYAELNKFGSIFESKGTIVSHDHSPKIHNKQREIALFEMENRPQLELDEEENFYLDEALVRYVSENLYEFIDTKIECFHPNETGLNSYIRKKTSPSSALAAIRKL